MTLAAKTQRALKEKELAQHLSDSGNAQRFVRQHRGSVLYCEGLGWLLWDGTRWTPAGGLIVKLAKETVSRIYQEAGRYSNVEQRQAVTTWALNSEKREETSLDDLAREMRVAGRRGRSRQRSLAAERQQWDSQSPDG